MKFTSLILSVVIVAASPLVTAGTELNGKVLYDNPGRGGCIQCHGEGGNAPVMPMYPKLGGQNEIYLYNQMLDYKNGRRKNGLYIPMEVAMQPFTDPEIKSMASYLADVGRER
ncbi:c-type cytochrome [Photobacterium sp. SDRW27]|uniref:c-type cytochrome n=1 Tax=Photobacterium obscurum TaxID=2829490 RepID=UPI0022431FD5|nr:c-type cytochrome [Photobacterium obscurum]MCW8328384.1 c-type cytochrome [Photobacterium obscurum]